MALGERIRELRKRAGLSQETLAVQLGVSRQAVTKWEMDQSAPSTENLLKLAEIFETTTDILLEVPKQRGKKEALPQTLCGKSCGDCTYQESLACEGCRKGPGASWRMECQIAKCCREKGHAACENCGFAKNCASLRMRARQPVIFLQSRQTEASKRERLQKSAKNLGKLLWWLFLLVIPGTIAGIMTEDHIVAWIPWLNFPGIALQAVCTVFEGWILLKLQTEDPDYRTAGICRLISGGVAILIGILPSPDVSGWGLVISIPMLIVELIGTKREFSAHETVLQRAEEQQPEYEDKLSQKWGKLWALYKYSVIGLFGGIVGMLLLPVFSALITLVSTVAMLVVSILQIVYLYQTANVFRDLLTEE